MSYLPKVEIPSKQGVYIRDFLSETSLVSHLQKQHGENFHNAILLIAAWGSLLGDSPTDLSKPQRIIHRFLNSLCDDLFAVIRDFTALAHEISKSLIYDRVGGEASISSFAVGMRDTPIFREYLHFYRTRDAGTLQYLLSFLNFGKKLYYEDDRLNSNALRKWFIVEQRLETLTLPPFVANLKKIMNYIFEEWEVDEFLPKHGSGSVAENGVVGVAAKNALFRYDSKIGYMYLRLPDPSDGANLYVTPNGGLPKEDKPSISFSRLKFVPKDWKSTRSICMEPIIYQYAQQGVRRWYEQNLSDSILNNHVRIHNQGFNQEASRLGSLGNMAYDTIDLSGASDSVSWDLVKRIFPAKVLKHLHATRTKVVKIPGNSKLREKPQMVAINKYAPMGSALCFPVQSTIYSAVVMMVDMAEVLGENCFSSEAFGGVDLDWLYQLTYFSANNGFKRQQFRIYGDDIACDSRATSNVVRALNLLGFEVNEDKSFTGLHAFRESCGEFHFSGKSVTPLIFKIDKVNARMPIGTLAGVIDHANRSYDWGYHNLRRFLIRVALYWPIEGLRAPNSGERNPVLFSSDKDDSFAIYHNAPRNLHLPSREYARSGPYEQGQSHYDLQRDEVLSVVGQPKSTVRDVENHDPYYYALWWRSRYASSGTGDVDTPAVSKIEPRRLGIGWRWTPS